MDQMEIGDLVHLKIREFEKFEILKVHSGWVYTRIAENSGQDCPLNSVFVPEPFAGLKTMSKN